MNTNIKRIMSGVLAFSFVASFPLTTSAQESLEAEQEILPGHLAIYAPDVVQFSDLTVSAEDQTNTVTFPSPVGVEDLRGSQNGQSPGFSATVTATHFISDNGTPADDTDDNQMDYTNLEITTSNLTSPVTPPSDLTGISNPVTSLTAFTSSDPAANPTSDPITIMIGDTTERDPGKWEVDVDLQLTVPAFTPTGVYTSTLTFTVA